MTALAHRAACCLCLVAAAAAAAPHAHVASPGRLPKSDTNTHPGAEEPEKEVKEVVDLGPSAEIGNVRVQCLTPSLVRVEPRGKYGFEDRTTFMVVNRDMGGVPIRSVEDRGDTTLVSTDHYSVLVMAVGFLVFGPDGKKLFDTGDNPDAGHSNLLFWPAPLTLQAYALEDYPRFHVPEWTVAPRSDEQGVPDYLQNTNGYDFGGNIQGDTYVFLLGFQLDTWNAARKDFAKLTGEVPVLPDYAFGTWFTWWHPYSEWEAKGDLDRWTWDDLPIDIWGLDMNWRHIHDNLDRGYNTPNDSSFADLDGFLSYLKDDKKVRTFFNDHPYPVGAQLSDKEIAFRWTGLTSWMAKGVSFWWFDHNWKFSIPPPFVKGSDKDSEWEGLTTVSWGSHVYFSIVAHYDKYARDPAGDKWYGGRPMALSKFSVPDWEPGMGPWLSAQSPSQHRYPVWWTGDAVDLQASVESMVDSGIYNFKPYVHSDCGGDYFSQAGDLLRWTAHCTFGTIFRYHGSDHRPWIWGMSTEAVIRQYLQVRYRMMPSLLAAGQKATQTGHPLVARCDLYWPWHQDSRSNSQYIFIDDLLVAPITDATSNWTSRDVWIPPGDWQDAWDGTIVSGGEDGTHLDAAQPYHKVPLWFRRDGGLIVLVDDPKTRIDDQDWSSLTLEAFPHEKEWQTNRTVYERSTGEPPRTDITMATDGKGQVIIDIGATYGGDEEERAKAAKRAWVVRFNLRPETHLQSAVVDEQDTDGVIHIYPSYGRYAARFGFFPLQGSGFPPAPFAGPVAEVMVPPGEGPHKVVVTVVEGDPLDMESLAESPGGPVAAAAAPRAWPRAAGAAALGCACAAAVGLAWLRLARGKLGRAVSPEPGSAGSPDRRATSPLIDGSEI